MFTRCPYRSCGQVFATNLPRAACTSCGRAFSCRDRSILEKIDREYDRRQALGILSGGPAGTVANLSCVVEDIRSLHNVGSIFRTADGAGVDKLYLCGISGCPPRKEIAKTSLGAEEHIAWEYHRSALDALDALKARGTFVVGLERTGDSTALTAVTTDSISNRPLCLVVGNEVTGLSAEALASCDIVCHLPMRGVKESLNVSVAFGIAAYAMASLVELTRLKAAIAGT